VSVTEVWEDDEDDDEDDDDGMPVNPGGLAATPTLGMLAKPIAMIIPGFLKIFMP
jgi:hypothetical protein